MARSSDAAQLRRAALYVALKIHYRSGRRVEDFDILADDLVRWCGGDVVRGESLRTVVDLTPVSGRETLLERAGRVYRFLVAREAEDRRNDTDQPSSAPREAGAARKKRTSKARTLKGP